MWKRRLLGLWAVAVLASVEGVGATEITGSHNNQMLDGYRVTAGNYDVPADTGGVPSATFNDNDGDGLYAEGTSTVTIEGGQFDANFNSGIETGAGATVTISGGAFNNNGEGVSADTSSVVTIAGGQFLNNVDYDLLANGGTIELYGGQFSAGSAYNLGIASTVDVYGAFAGVADGQTVTISVNGSGSFYGQLEDNSTTQTYTYIGGQGTLELHGTGTLIPEPTTLSLMGMFFAELLARRTRWPMKAV